MAIITLTTDFGVKDYFVAAVKGAIYSELDSVNIVDISHSITPFNILEAAYTIKNAYHNFPKGSIHVIGIDSELHPENVHIALLLDGHYFICDNNGIMSMICSNINPEKIVEINIHSRTDSSFPVLNTFVKVACHIARGGTLEVIGRVIPHIKPISNFTPLVNSEKNQIIGSVIYVDNYGNVVTNIEKKFFEQTRQSRSFIILALNHKFGKVHNKYSDIVNFDLPENERQDAGKGLAVFNAAGHIEIAMYKSDNTTVGSASTLMGLGLRDTITINFNAE